jgi:SAM-dependent methyltransferase
MNDNENTWDKLLQIKTTGRDDSNSDQYRYPYEPTPYSVLERLANSGLIRKKDVVLDYGCGKGRVDFFLSYQTKATTIGIEYDERIYQSSLENQKTAVSKARTEFVLARAEEYEVPSEVNRYYFFNPFSVELLRKVMARIIESYYENPREMFLFFYYPSEEYISYLMTVDELEFYDEIECGDLFEGNDPRERIMIFSLP